jgi:hypothetical protein
VLLLQLLLLATNAVLPYCGDAPVGAVIWQLHAATKLNMVATNAPVDLRILFPLYLRALFAM